MSDRKKTESINGGKFINPRRAPFFEKGNKAAEKEIDWDKLEKLCAIQCTGEECASVLEVDYSTLDRHINNKYGYGFVDYFKKHSGKGKMSLRRRQFAMSETNPTMAIWLGKQYLGQSDKNESNVKLNCTFADIIKGIHKGNETN